MQDDSLWMDFETRSRVDLKAAGAKRYARDPSTGITVVKWHFRGARKSACPVHPSIGTHTLADLYADVRQATRLVAHHANFDISILTALNPFLSVPVSAIDCTMGRAQALALPGGLNELCKALNIKGKDLRGHQLVMATCKPKRDGTFNEDFNTYVELMEYCDSDVDCLINVDGILPPLSPDERRVFERTWRKNAMGLPIDVKLATAIALRREEIEEETTAKLIEITGSAVTRITQRERIITWANGGNRNAGLTSTKKHEVAEVLENEDLHPDVREVLELLQESGGSAPTKAQALLDRHVDGWLKDATRYFGARSGRGTSEGANMFNIARPSGKYKVEEVIAHLKNGHRFDNTALTDCLRGCIIAPVGYMVIDNDLANAELRLALWQAGDTERLSILKRNGDLYMANAIRCLRLPETATKETHPKERQIFKSVTLGGNYSLGPKTYMAHQRREGRKIEMAEATSDIYGYRNANPLLFARDGLLANLNEAFKMAIYDAPGRTFLAGKIAFQKDQNKTVWMLLPSGRAVPHYNAHVTHEGDMVFYRAKYGRMMLQRVFGGSLLEISCQCMTRDLITAAEYDVENEMPDTVLMLDVYDSILALAPAVVAEERAKQMREIMRRPRSWTAGLPVDAEGYVHTRMRK